jgi:LuxR family maltose regulon positive regulatory protein
MQSRLQQARGDLEGAYQSLTQAERAYHLKASMLTRFRLESQKARLNLEAGLLEEVIHWVRGLERAGAEAESALFLPTLLHEVVQLILARVYLAKGEPENALLVLEHIHTRAEADGRGKHVIEIYTLKALALQALKRSQAALEHVEQALRLAEREDFKRVFLDCAFFEKGVPIQQLLYKAAECGVAPGFTGKLLLAFPMIATDKQEYGKDLVEPLSKREIEVLECLARGVTNHEIAQELIISLDTVKTHTSNIYSKLGVSSRTQAVIKAKALGLIN